MKRWALPIAVLSALASCSTPQVVTATNNFDRASDVDFLCLDTSTTPPRALPTRACGINPQDNSAATPNRFLFALVTQAERGELAAVNLAASSGTALVDNTGNIPGYTFIPVAALPTAILVDVRTDTTPSSVWVASAADRTIERLDAGAVLRDPRSTDPGRVTARLPMNGAPHDLALDTVDGRTLLYATVPDRGAVAVLDVTDPLRPMDMGFTPVTVPAMMGDNIDGGTADGGLGVLPGHPVALAVDTETHRVYVTDDRANVIHVLDGRPLREVARIDVGAPTRAVALTGWARRVSCEAAAEDPDHFARARYLYVTHATTGAILVADVTRGERVLPNVLPAPNPERRLLDPTLGRERVALATPAVALVPIHSTEYQGIDGSGRVLIPAGCLVSGGCRGASAIDAAQLHGVFVAAVLRDGRVAVIDVDDYDAAARFGPQSVREGMQNVPSRNGYRFIRHAPRASTKLTEAPKLSAPPTVSTLLRGTQRVPRSDLGMLPYLACSSTRTPGAQGCAPDDTWVELARRPGARVEYIQETQAGDRSAPVPEPSCGEERVFAPAALTADPYIVRNDAWELTWDALIPGLDVYGGAFTATDTQLAVEAPGAGFCTRGAFADDAFGVRDAVTIVGDVNALPSDREMCVRTFGTATSPRNRDFVIEEAWQERLVLRTPTGFDPMLVRRCFPQATRFEVRTHNSWLVTGRRAGYQPAVTTDTMGRCIVDMTRQEAAEALARTCLTARVAPSARIASRCLAGRACLGPVDRDTGAVSAATTPVFANASLCLQVFPAVTRMGNAYVRAVIERDTQISFTVTGAWEPLLLPGGTFPVAARFVPWVERLYVVDTQSSGLIEYRTTPLSRTRNFN